MRPSALGKVRVGKIASAVELTEPQTVVTVLVEEPRQHAAVRGHLQILDVVSRLFDPLPPIRAEIVKRKAAELAALVRDHVETGPVRRPGARNVDRVVIVRRELVRVAGLYVDEKDREVAVVAEVDRQQLRTVGRPGPGERELPLAEHLSRLTRLGVAHPALHVGRLARVRRVGEPPAIRRPGLAADEMLYLRLVRL